MENRKNRISVITFFVIILVLVAGAVLLFILRGDSSTMRAMTEVEYDENIGLWIDLWDLEETENGNIRLKLSGWAIDQANQCPFKAVYLTANGRAQELSKRDRPDVAEHYQLDNPDTTYGYVGELSLGKAKNLRDDSVKFMFVLEDGKTYSLKPVQYSDPTLAKKEVILEQTCQYWIDQSEVSADGSSAVLHLSGWAFDKTTSLPFQAVYLRTGEKTIKVSVRDREDVVRAYKLEDTGTVAYGFKDDISLGSSDTFNADQCELLFIREDNTYCVAPLQLSQNQEAA